MPTIRFMGEVMPVHTNITMGNIPTITWQPSDLTEPPINFTIHIANSKIVIDCEVGDYDKTDLSDIYWRVLAMARGSVDLIAFSTGLGLTPYLHTMSGPDGKPQPLKIHLKYLEGLCTAFSLGWGISNVNNDFDQVYRMVLSDPKLFLVLNDLATAITHDQQSVTNCARAMDGISKLIAPNERTDVAWAIMRNNLNLREDYLKFISNTSKGPRHADRTYIYPNVVAEVFKRSWSVFNRYLEYRKRGDQPLSKTDFPELIHDPAFDSPKP